MARLPKDYDCEPLVNAIVALNWSPDHAKAATRIIQSMVTDSDGNRFDDDDAVWILGSLLNRRLIRMQVHPDDVAKAAANPKVRRRARYVRIPQSEP